MLYKKWKCKNFLQKNNRSFAICKLWICLYYYFFFIFIGGLVFRFKKKVFFIRNLWVSVCRLWARKFTPVHVVWWIIIPPSHYWFETILMYISASHHVAIFTISMRWKILSAIKSVLCSLQKSKKYAKYSNWLLQDFFVHFYLLFYIRIRQRAMWLRRWIDIFFSWSLKYRFDGLHMIKKHIFKCQFRVSSVVNSFCHFASLFYVRRRFVKTTFQHPVLSALANNYLLCLNIQTVTTFKQRWST